MSFKNKICLMFFLLLTTSSTFVLAKNNDPSIDKMHENYDKTEQCLTCHGSYQENAEKTERFGKWNPHNSIHGGYVDCTNCHQQNKLTRNYCSYCHEYNPTVVN
ncbi:MAG: cytochrome c3 family protein [Saezia sp.]